jgi:hypothetical protein
VAAVPTKIFSEAGISLKARIGSDAGICPGVWIASGGGIGTDAGITRNNPALLSTAKTTHDVTMIDISNICLISAFS